MTKKLRGIGLLVVAVVVALLLAACEQRGDAAAESSAAIATEGAKDKPGSHSDVCAAGFSAFQTEFLAKIQNEVCSGCHQGENPAAPPWLMGADANIYLTVKNYVTFADLTGSRIYFRAGNRHCGAGCNDDMAARMKAYLQAWWDGGEKTCDQSSTFRTAAKPVPTDLPHDPYPTMSWDLSTISVDLRGVQLTAEIKKFTDAAGPTQGSYSIRKPRFVSDHPVALSVEKMRVLVNTNIQDSANEFERVHAVVSPDVSTGSSLSYPVMSPEPLTLLEQHPGADQLMISFGTLATTTPRACRAMDKFTSEVMPIVEDRNCKGCHMPGATPDGAASARFDMSGDAPTVCAKFLTRTWTDPNVLPVLVQFPLNGKFEHPRIFTGMNNVLPDWSDWIQAEWQ